MIQIQIIKELTLTDFGHQDKTTYTIKRCRYTQPVQSDDELKAAVARGIAKVIAAAKARRDAQ